MVFFNKYLSEAVRDSGVMARPVVAPQMYTINDFFLKVEKVQPVERVRLLIELYECYKD